MAKTRAKPVIRRSTKTARKKVGKKSKKKPASGFKVLAQLAVAAPSDLTDAVKQEIRAACPAPPREITDDMDLSDDLRLTGDLKRGLAGAFQQIARRFKPGARISLDDCGGLTDVASAIALVAKRAGF